MPGKIVLFNPKYPSNLGAIVRIASAYGFSSVYFTGNRINLQDMERTPRELRMREYQHVQVIHSDRPFDLLGAASVPVAVEFRESAESLFDFGHPSDATYVFGPEDGSIPSHILRLCQRFVVIPTPHCLNIATAVATVAYDRSLKSHDSSLHLSSQGPR